MDKYFITGSSSGLGKAFAELCLANGHSVTGISRSTKIRHPNYTHFSIDLSKQEALSGFTFPETHLSAGYKRIILINNAAKVAPVKYCGKAENSEIIGAYTLNVIAPAVLTNQFIHTFENYNAEKIIVTISSGAANYPVDGWSVYCSSKAAIDMFSRTVAMEREKEKNSFSVASIAPGIVDTAMQSAIRQADEKNFSRVPEFINYKEQGLLQSPEATAERIFQAINRLNNKKDVVFSVKN